MCLFIYRKKKLNQKVWILILQYCPQKILTTVLKWKNKISYHK